MRSLRAQRHAPWASCVSMRPRRQRLGHRLDRRRAVAAREQAPDRVHRGERRRARREGEEHRSCEPRGEGVEHAHDVVEPGSGSASPSPRRGRSRPSAGSSMSPLRNSTRPPLRSVAARGEPFARQLDQRRREIDGHHGGAAPGRFDRERAGAAAGVEHARGRAGRPAASRAASRACGRGRRARWRGCGRPARRRSGGPRPRRRCGRSRSRSRRGAAGRWRVACASPDQSKPSRSKMSRSFIGTADSGSLPSHSVAASRRYSLLHRFELRRVLHLEQRRLLQAAAADHVEVGEVRQRASGRSASL